MLIGLFVPRDKQLTNAVVGGLYPTASRNLNPKSRINAPGVAARAISEHATIDCSPSPTLFIVDIVIAVVATTDERHASDPASGDIKRK